MNNDTVVLCPACVPMSCCPSVQKDSEKFCIKDDYGNSISLTLSELNEVVEKIDEFSSVSGAGLDN